MGNITSQASTRSLYWIEKGSGSQGMKSSIAAPSDKRNELYWLQNLNKDGGGAV